MANIQKQLQNINLDPKKPEYGKKPLAEKKVHDPKLSLPGAKVELTTNLRKMTLAKNVPIYKYSVEIKMIIKKDGSEVGVEISKSAKKDAEHIRDKEKCRKIYLAMVNREKKAFANEGLYFYDQQASLYTLKLIPGAEDGLKYTFKASDFTKRIDVDRYEVRITPCETSFQTTTNDLANTVNSVPLNADKTLIEALNQIVSGPAVKNTNIITLGNSIHYLDDVSKANIRNEDCTPFNERTNKYGGIGVSTAVKTLKGTQEDRGFSAYVVTELKKSTFHSDNNTLLEKLSSLDGFNDALAGSKNFNSTALDTILKSVKGSQCYLNYGANKTLGEDALFVTIKAFGPPPKEQTFKLDNQEISVYDYFVKVLKVALKYPQYKTVVCKGKTGKSYYPIECLNVCNSQIATTEQLIYNEQEDAIKKSAIVPSHRKLQTDKIVRHIGLSGSNIGGIVDIAEDGANVTGRVLPKPDIVYGGGSKALVNEQKRNWRATKCQFFDAKALKQWEVIVIGTDIDYKYYISSLKSKGSNYGMRIDEPTYTVVRDGSDLENIFRKAKNNGTKFLFFITRDRLNLHPMIKNFEQLYDITTQEVRETVAKRTIERGQAVTLENVIAKTNIKLGGLNHTVNGKDTLMTKIDTVFIGFETSQRNTSSDAPIMIGYSANVLDNSQKFSGGFYYVERGPDAFGSVVKRVTKKVIQTSEKNRGKKPAWIVFYFNGMSEGQYTIINEKYVASIKETCMEFTGYRPNITILAVSKMHNERIYNKTIEGTKADEQNVKPGTIVDDVIVSPVLTEFYLTAQNAFQGTAKSPKFTVIFDTSKIPLHELESTTYHLCFLHEIVSSTISLPAPLLIADRFSKRATMLFVARGIARSGNYGNGDDIPWDIERINRDLSYEGKTLEFVRYNA